MKLHLNSHNILTFNLFKNLFYSYKKNFHEIFGNIEAKDFFDEWDEDNDGFLNEDEQILIFSLIKAKLCKLSEKLLTINEYNLFKKLNSKIKVLEKNINNYQCRLRKNIYNKQLLKYNNIGKISINKFTRNYSSKMNKFLLFKKERILDFEEKKKEDINTIETKLTKLSETIKIKPKKQLKEFQIQEKLVALEERIEEANNFKKQIKILKRKESERLNNIFQNNIEIKKRKVNKINKKHENYLNYKLINDENKLKIKMAKESDILNKKIALHQNNILRIQKFSYQSAFKKGNIYGDLINLKSRLKKQNKLLQNYKCNYQNNVTENDNETNLKTTKLSTNKRELKRNQTVKSFKTPNLKINNSLYQLKLLKNSKFIIRFYIRQKFGVDVPCNIKNNNYNNKENMGKIEKYLKNPNEINKEIPQISKYYDDELKEIVYNEDLI